MHSVIRILHSILQTKKKTIFQKLNNLLRNLIPRFLYIMLYVPTRRNCRQSIDLVFDDVEKELLRERELILGINDQLEDLQDKVVLQIRKLRAFVYNLAVDLRCKKNALQIEEHNENLNENTVKLSILNNKNIFKPA